ncbi:hypothetical protein Nmel_005574 [Mimus melanotis]
MERLLEAAWKVFRDRSSTEKVSSGGQINILILTHKVSGYILSSCILVTHDVIDIVLMKRTIGLFGLNH